MQETWETQVLSLGWEIPWRRAGQRPLVFLPGESQGQWNLASYRPWGCKEWDTRQQLKHFKITCVDALGHLLCLMFSELTVSMVWYKTRIGEILSHYYFKDFSCCFILLFLVFLLHSCGEIALTKMASVWLSSTMSSCPHPTSCKQWLCMVM